MIRAYPYSVGEFRPRSIMFVLFFLETLSAFLLFSEILRSKWFWINQRFSATGARMPEVVMPFSVVLCSTLYILHLIQINHHQVLLPDLRLPELISYAWG